MMSAKVPKKVQNYIINKKFVTVKDIKKRFDFTDTTAHNYLSRLNKNGIITRIGYGRYKVGAYRPVSLIITPRVEQIVSIIKKKMPYVEFTVWSTENLAEFSHYAIGKDVVFIEADKRPSRKIREVLLGNNIRSLLASSRSEIGDIFSLLEEPIVIFQRKEAYATLIQDSVRIPRMERIAIDLYFYITRIGFPYPPDEYGRFLYNILKISALNFDMLVKYATRRGLRDEILNLLSKMKNLYPELDIPELGGTSEKEVIIEEIVTGALH